MTKEYGYILGDVCNREGCIGIIKEHNKEGCCSCHINPPCSYCTEPVAYCEVCCWDEAEENREIYNRVASKLSDTITPEYTYKTPIQILEEKPNNLFCAVIFKAWHSGCEVWGKHPNMTKDEICMELGIREVTNMPRFKFYDEKMYKVSYFTD